MSDAFDTHTAVEEDVLGPYRATVDAGMSGFKGAHGGYLMAIALRAMSNAVGDPTRVPRSLKAYLLAPVDPGPVDLHTRVERAGGSMTTASMRLEQDRAPGAIAIASFGRAAESLTHTDRVMPQVAPPEELEPLSRKPVPDADAGLHVEHRPAGPLPLAGGDEGEIRVWMRLAERRLVDAFVATFLADSGPPALYGAMREFVAMPSTDISLHFSGAPRAPRGEWVLGVFRNRLAGEGYAVEDGELWTPEGELVEQSRQRRRILG